MLKKRIFALITVILIVVAIIMVNRKAKTQLHYKGVNDHKEAGK